MKIFFYFLAASLLVGCNQLLHGELQPVRFVKKNTYMTNCGGAVETWSTCNDKARKTCQGDYMIIREDQNSTGTSRELIFECKTKL